MFSGKELLKSLDPTLSAVAVDNVTPPHVQQPLPGLNDGKNKPRSKEKGDLARGDHWADVTFALNSSEVRVLRERGDGFAVKCDDGEACWRPMVTTHWPRLLRQFGFPVESRFVRVTLIIL